MFLSPRHLNNQLHRNSFFPASRRLLSQIRYEQCISLGWLLWPTIAQQSSTPIPAAIQRAPSPPAPVKRWANARGPTAKSTPIQPDAGVALA